MDESLIRLGLRSQTVLGGIQLLLITIFGITLIAFLKSTYNREIFTCEPEISSITKQLCYDEYSSAMNQWFAPLYFVVLAYVVLVVLSISFMLYGAFTLRQIERDRNDDSNQSTKAGSFKRAYLLHVCCRLIFIVVMIGIFCGNQTLIVPKTYTCSVAAVATPIPLNQTETDLHCHDQHYREKSICNISIIAIEVFILILCIIEFIQVKRLTPPKNLLIKLLGEIFDAENNNPLVGEHNCVCITRLTAIFNRPGSYVAFLPCRIQFNELNSTEIRRLIGCRFSASCSTGLVALCGTDSNVQFLPCRI